MPKPSKYPKLRVSVKRGKAGQVWQSYWYDMRGTGQRDIALGNNREQALKRWAEIALDAPRIAGTLEEAFRAWEQDTDSGLLAERLKDSTRVGYEKCLRALRPVFSGARWDEVTLPVMAQYVRKRTAKTRARQEMQVLSVVWNWARVQGMTSLHFPAADMGRSGWKGIAQAREVEVTDAAFAAIYKHADACLRDALDIATATGLRVMDVIGLRLSDVRDGKLIVQASKTGKRAEFDLSLSTVLLPIIERRRAMREPEHVFLLAAGRRPVTHRRLSDRFTKARALAAKEHPACAALFLRDMRKRASQLAGSLAEASTLLQHSSQSVTQRHYRSGDKLKPVR